MSIPRLARNPATSLLALLALAAIAAAPAQAQVYATGVSASFPDANGKVPAFNAVAGSAISTWSIGFAQAVLTHGQVYNYCVSVGSGTANGKASVSFKLVRSGVILLTKVIVASKDFTISPNGIWYYCSGYLAVPNSPGPATLQGVVNYTASGATKSVQSKTMASVLLN